MSHVIYLQKGRDFEFFSFTFWINTLNSQHRNINIQLSIQDKLLPNPLSWRSLSGKFCNWSLFTLKLIHYFLINNSASTSELFTAVNIDILKWQSHTSKYRYTDLHSRPNSVLLMITISCIGNFLKNLGAQPKIRHRDLFMNA